VGQEQGTATIVEGTITQLRSETSKTLRLLSRSTMVVTMMMMMMTTTMVVVVVVVS
jgi:hypothetical protein